MTTVIHHTTVVTGDRDPSIHFNAAIAIENDLIAAMGPSDEVMVRFPNAEGVDGRGKLVTPGFANCQPVHYREPQSRTANQITIAVA